MSFFEIFFISVSLSIDAFVCAVIFGKISSSNSTKIKIALSFAFCFGFFQFLMPLIGFYGGINLLKYIESYDHFVAAGLLFAVSINMIKEGLSKEENEIKPFSLWVLLSLGIATSIDALAVGLSISSIDNRIMLICSIIGIVCFVITYIGFMLGNFLSKFKKLDLTLNILGALTLSYIAIKILIEHHVFD